MSVDRAKQFMPFDSLKGFREAIMQKETVAEPRKTLSEDMIEHINDILTHSNPGDFLEITFYKDDSYQSVFGELQSISPENMYLTIDALEIPFQVIYDMKKKC